MFLGEKNRHPSPYSKGGHREGESTGLSMTEKDEEPSCRRISGNAEA